MRDTPWWCWALIALAVACWIVGITCSIILIWMCMEGL